jgi:hypothetical protein
MTSQELEYWVSQTSDYITELNRNADHGQ